MAFSIVIPSNCASNVIQCVQHVRDAGETARIIVVDDGIGPCFENCEPEPFWFVRGEKPFVFARNVNIGIAAVGEDDVIILNDDALLTRYKGFSAMAEAVHAPWNKTGSNSQWGVVASTCNNVGNENQFQRRDWHGVPIRTEPRMVCFVCVYIPRSTIRTVGLLDERFVDYGMDDDDYCLRVRQAGLKIGICDDCFVDHSKLKSAYRSEGGRGGNFHPNMARFIEKWGHDNRGLGREESPFKHLFPAI